MHKLVAASFGVLALAFGPGAYADALDGLELDVIDRDEAPEAMMQRIELPESVRGEQREAGQAGGGIASEARELGADFGQETAEEARERRGPPEQLDRPGGRPEGGGRPDDAPVLQPERPDGGGGNRPDEAQPARPR